MEACHPKRSRRDTIDPGRSSWCAPKVLRTPALPPKPVSRLLRSLAQSGAKMEQVEIERAKRKQLERLDSTLPA